MDTVFSRFSTGRRVLEGMLNRGRHLFINTEIDRSKKRSSSKEYPQLPYDVPITQYATTG